MDQDKVKKWVHDLNNRVGAVLNTAELLQMEKLPERALERSKAIENKALEMRQLIRDMAEHLLE